jgi:hypothetical protein
MEPAITLLTKLFETWQGNPESSKRKSLPISRTRASAYFETVNPEEKDNLHASLKNAESAGCISLVWEKYPNDHLLKKVWLESGEKLAIFLGQPLAKDIASQSLDSILKEAPTDSWSLAIIQRIIKGWEKNKSVYGIEPGDTQSVVLVTKALFAAANNMHKDMDLRTFSAKYLGDSKTMEKIQNRFTNLWNENFNTGLDAQELYESLDLLKFPQTINIKGPVRIKVGDCWIDFAQTKTYLGIPPDKIREIELISQPDYVLSIENLASFNRHCKEIDDKGIVVFSSGFLSPKSAVILGKIEALLPEEVSLYHWGDIDSGGLNIYRHISSIIKRPVQRHLMDKSLLLEHGKTPSKTVTFRTLQKSAYQDPEIVELIDICLQKQIILEQERIDPKNPIKTS